MDIEQEQLQHPTKVISVFNVWECKDETWGLPHYPVYSVSSRIIGNAFSLEDAQRIVRTRVAQISGDYWGDRIHHFRVLEMPVGVPTELFDVRSERVYDNKGILLEQNRFKPGDICEIVLGIYMSEAILGIVADIKDDVCQVLTNDPLTPLLLNQINVFQPKAKVHPGTERRLRKLLDDFRTLPMRRKIADTAALAKLRFMLNALGWDDAEITLADDLLPDGFARLVIKGVKGFPEGLHLDIGRHVMQSRPDRVEATLKRLAGKETDVRGYSLKKNNMQEEITGYPTWYTI